MSACTSTSAPSTRRLAERLPVAGIVPFSATDWPGMLTVSVFTQGCPLRCIYCHNATLQEFRPGAVRFGNALELLGQRRGLIDALLISGGEPTAHLALPHAIAATHEEGFPVGLHTSGYLPARIRQLLASPETTPDWVGFDVKALEEDFPAVTGGTRRMASAYWESLRMLVDAGVAVQARTTVWAGGCVDKHLDELRGRVAELGLELVVQQARGVDKHGRYVA